MGCRRTASFRRCVVMMLCVLGLYLLLSASLNKGNYEVHHEHPPLLMKPLSLSSPHSATAQHASISMVALDSLSWENGNTRTVIPRALLLYDKESITVAKGIRILLESHRIPYDAHLLNPGETHQLVESYSEHTRGKVIAGRYCLLVCADVMSLYKRSRSLLQHYLNYSAQFNVTFINLASSASATDVITDFTLASVNASKIKAVRLNPSRNFYYLKTDEEWTNEFAGNISWTTFIPADSAYINKSVEVLANITYHRNGSHDQTTPLAVVVGGNLRQVLIGAPWDFWMTKMLMLEVIRSYSVHPLARFGRERWIMIDIDDIFVAPKGLKMTAEDVTALIRTQEELQGFAPGLRFNLGFCGYYYNRGTESENNGSQSLVQNRDKFWWFDHVYNHFQPHSRTEQNLRTYMRQSMKFASNYSLPFTENSYSVSPHHSGVYPVYTPLYRAWVELLNVTMTTTEEYPHLYPSHRRRGFIYQGIMVLPRQTCRLFTHNYLFTDFVSSKVDAVGVASRGREGLRSVAQGEVFNTLLYTPVSIFMTHVTNYAKDRLAPFLFLNLFKFTTRWTKLQLLTAKPLQLGKTYFSLFPEDKAPLWTSPCRDKRHMDIWGSGKNCSRLPLAVILGPQKSGSTALQFFMKAHPNMATSFQSPDKFEEVQFFSDEKLYLRGIEWYMDQFPYPLAQSNQLIFEKSATYFTHPRAPERIVRLMPKAKLLVILCDPVKRAYSWYQHMRAHGDEIAMNYSFLDVLSSDQNHTHSLAIGQKLHRLREHCLEPGRYYKYAQGWLKHFPANHVLFVDGELLRLQPTLVMMAVQKFLKVSSLDYSEKLSFSKRKGYYCVLEDGRQRCLGPGKGRLYPPLQDSEQAFLQRYYSHDNWKLTAMLRDLKRPLPHWLTAPSSHPDG